MKCTKIMLKWMEKGKKNQKKLDRKEVGVVFKGLALGFSDDNEISKKLLEILPEVDEIFLNKDSNETQDVPYIAYYINGKENILKIKRYHKVVWSILEKYCTK